MEYLDAFQYILDALEIFSERGQLRKDALEDATIYLSQIAMAVNHKTNPAYSFILDKTVQAVSSAKEIQMNFIPAEIRKIITDALNQLKIIIGNMCYDYFTVHDIPENEEDIQLLLKVIKLRRGELVQG